MRGAKNDGDDDSSASMQNGNKIEDNGKTTNDATINNGYILQEEEEEEVEENDNSNNEDPAARPSWTKKEHHHHKKVVSWGGNELFEVNTLTQQQQHPMQEQMDRENKDCNQQPSTKQQGLTEDDAPGASNVTTNEAMDADALIRTLEDKSPFEVEVETHIAKAAAIANEVSLGASAGVNSSRISLEDVKKCSPSETEAETHIAKAIEDRAAEARQRGESNDEPAILRHVPDQAMDKVEDEAKDTNSVGRPLLPSADPQRRQSFMTRGDELAALATAMNEIHAKQVANPAEASASTRLSVQSHLQASDVGAGSVDLGDGNSEEQQSLPHSVSSYLRRRSSRSKTVLEEIKSVDEKESIQDEEIGLHDHHQSSTRSNNVLSFTEILMKDFHEFYQTSRSGWWAFRILLYLVVSAVAASALLFYVFGNPPTGVLINGGEPVNEALINEEGHPVSTTSASASWSVLFCVRQIVTLALAKSTEVFLIHFLSIKTKWMSRVVGPHATLFLIQGKGWPFILFMWGVYDFCFVYGRRPFFNHWLYWQSQVKLFNQTNPGGNVVLSEWYRRSIASAIWIGLMVTLKRLWLGIYLGRQTFDQYSEQLANVMKKMLLISEVGSLAAEIEASLFAVLRRDVKRQFSYADRLGTMIQDELDDGSTLKSVLPGRVDSEDESHIFDPNDRNPLTGRLNTRQKDRIVQLLGEWEEPFILNRKREPVSVSAILQFRRTLTFLKTKHPFSEHFGPAATREEMIESAQDVYGRLMLRNNTADTLDFELMALIGIEKGGTLDQTKLRDLIRLFRPDRDGKLSLVEFVKSIDRVYQELRMLGASIENSGKMDIAFESVFNIAFYVVAVTLILSVFGFDALSIFLSISGVIVAFAFMIGSAASVFFEGILLIVRRPYDIGDRIHLSAVTAEPSLDGSTPWQVEDLTLSATTVVSPVTNERATLSNGSMAHLRIINSSRSDPANLRIKLKFPLDVRYKNMQLFERALREYVRNRPREWREFSCFIALRVEADKGFIEYLLSVGHRESWDKGDALYESKANLTIFASELAKKLDIRYTTPRMPVDIAIKDEDGSVNFGNREQFRSVDLTDFQAFFAPDNGLS